MSVSLSLAIASFGIPATILVTAAKGRLWQAATLWFFWPVLIYIFWIGWEAVVRAPTADPQSSALLGFSLFSAILIIPWVLISAVALLLARALRWLIKRPAPEPTELPRPSPSTAPVPSGGKANPDTGPQTAGCVRYISPDGTACVELKPIEWFNSQWIEPPRVTDMVKGKIVLDLWGSDWNAVVDFAACCRVRLHCSRHSSHYRGASLTVVLDLAEQTYQIIQLQSVGGPLPPSPISKIAQGLEDASRRSAAAATGRLVPDMTTAGPMTQWRSACAIPVGLLLVIGTLVVAAVHWEEDGELSTPVLTVPEGGFHPAGG